MTAEAERHFAEAASLIRRREFAAAATAYDRAIAADPSLPGPWINRVAALSAAGDSAGAWVAAQEAVRRFADFAAAHSAMGDVALAAGMASAAEAAFAKAAALAPDMPGLRNSLALALQGQGRVAEARAVFAEAQRLAPGDRQLASNALMACQYDPPADNLRAQAQAWPGADRVFPRPAPMAPLAGRRLRIGYASPDFCSHSCSYFLVPLLAGHDRAAVDLFAYSDVADPDGVTAAFRNLVPNWRETFGLDDAAFCAAVRNDGIDVLVDCAGHTRGNRLGAFAQRPAPVQFTWLGYPDTTGLACFDARLVDAVSDPPGDSDDAASEPLARLGGGFLAYMPPPFAPPLAPPPIAKLGVPTFGSFNNLPKISDASVALWACVLRAVPEAQLAVKAMGLGEASAQARLAARFAASGIDPARVVPIPFDSAVQSHIARYSGIDIALDTTPYNGTTTTCEALWMGVPVVTLAGRRHAARVGASLLTQIGAEDWIAGDCDAFARIAAGLARDPPALAAIRADLRRRMLASPLCDGARLARQIEVLCRDIWLRVVSPARMV
jgi:predicted O-linked N-acetylglucosamine transferase (SPINDLY family)